MTSEPALHLIFSLKFVSPLEKFFAKVLHLIGVAFTGVAIKNGKVDPIAKAITVASSFI